MDSDSGIEGIFDALWNDLRMEDDFTHPLPLLAHYTSIQTLEGIMANDELWFSNPLFMNDLDELRFGMNESAQEIRHSQQLKRSCGTEERYKVFMESFEQMFKEFSEERAFDVYVLCFQSMGRARMMVCYLCGGGTVAMAMEPL